MKYHEKQNRRQLRRFIALALAPIFVLLFVFMITWSTCWSLQYFWETTPAPARSFVYLKIGRGALNAGFAKHTFTSAGNEVRFVNPGWQWNATASTQFPYAHPGRGGVRFAGFEFWCASSAFREFNVRGHYSGVTVGMPLWMFAILPFLLAFRWAIMLKSVGRKATLFPVILDATPPFPPPAPDPPELSNPPRFPKRACAIALLAVLLSSGAVFLLRHPKAPPTVAKRPAATLPYKPGRTFTNSIGMRLVEIRPGTFIMGSPPNEAGRYDGETQHQVTLTKPFNMGAFPVTVGQFKQFISATSYVTEAESAGGANGPDGRGGIKTDPSFNWRTPGFPQTDDHPVVCVSWNDANTFCSWLSAKEGKSYRLPSEAQYEYARRAGTTTAFPWGDDPDDSRAWENCADLAAKNCFPDWFIFPWRDGYIYTSPVGTFPPNAWGLYDTHGNVHNWCNDWAELYPPGNQIDPTGPKTGEERVMRCGSWFSSPDECRSAFRISAHPSFRGATLGFRIVLISD